jgi:MFS family permease
VLAPLGGALADRHSRLGLILAGDVIRGVAVLGLAGLMFARPEADVVIVVALAVVAVLGGVVNAAFQPAIAAAIPDLVPAGRVAAANSLNQLSVQGSAFVGQAAGGVLFAALGAPFLFLIDGVTYLFSAASEAFIRLPQERRAEDLRARGFAAYWRDTIDGVRYLRGRPGMASFLGVAAAINFFAMPVILLLPFYVSGPLGRGATWYGFLLAAFGAGAVAGYLAAGALPIAPRRRPAVFAAALAGTGACFLAAGQVGEPTVALALFFTVGALTGLVNIVVLTLFQVTTPSEMRGRVMALVIALSGAAAPLGMAVGGVLGDATGQDIPLVYGACGAAIALLALCSVGLRAVREFLASEAVSAGREAPAG